LAIDLSGDLGLCVPISEQKRMDGLQSFQQVKLSSRYTSTGKTPSQEIRFVQTCKTPFNNKFILEVLQYF